MKVKNNGLVPVWTMITAIAPLSVNEAPTYLMPRSESPVILDVLPQHVTGIYQGYVQIYNYPVLLPRAWISYLHRISPLFAITVVGFVFGMYFYLIFKILDHIHGFEGFIPLKALKDKLMNCRMKRTRAEFLGRRRVR